MDQVVDLHRAPVTEAEIKSKVLGTFLCSAGSGTSCAVCHPSCTDCTSGLCNTCLSAQGTKMADGAFCMCGTDPSWVECPRCHASCGTCAVYTDKEKCTSCKVQEATLSNPAGGSCSCLKGFVYKNYATTACDPCVPGCPYCVDTSSEGCMKTKELTIFASNLASSYSLPLLSQASGLICYRQPVPTTTCDTVSNTLSVAVTGTIASDGSGLHPILPQCYELLRAEWGYVIYWYTHFFGHFNAPVSATETEKYNLKTVLWLWILQFGSYALTTESAWQDIVNTFNNDSLVWGGLLAWSGGYLAGGTTHSYPTGLTPTSPELSLFNRFSEVCATAGCGHKTHCLEVASTSTCATS